MEQKDILNDLRPECELFEGVRDAALERDSAGRSPRYNPYHESGNLLAKDLSRLSDGL